MKLAAIFFDPVKSTEDDDVIDSVVVEPRPQEVAYLIGMLRHADVAGHRISLPDVRDVIRDTLATLLGHRTGKLKLEVRPLLLIAMLTGSTNDVEALNYFSGGDWANRTIYDALVSGVINRFYDEGTQEAVKELW